MIHTKQTIVVTCDRCGKTVELNSAAFSIAENQLQREGWTVFMDWIGNRHYCPDCTKELNKTAYNV